MDLLKKTNLSLKVLDQSSFALPKLVVHSLVVKVASRCNLNCDYCYMYHHRDQSYKKQPYFFSEENAEILGRRIHDYLIESDQKTFSICFHGGEPLLAGIDRFRSYLDLLRKPLEKDQKLSFSLQTNGVLISREYLDFFRDQGVGVCLSMDGPRHFQDQHRLDHRKRSSFDAVSAALKLLTTEYRDLFQGVLTVIDPKFSPEELLDYFASFDLPFYDILLPDANHEVPPPYRDKDPDLFLNWLLRAMTHWYTHYPKMPIRIFEAAASRIAGHFSSPEIFGNSDLGYFIVETDGSYHYTDLLKSAYEGASHTGLHIQNTSIVEMVDSPKMRGFQFLLEEHNLCETCQNCSEREICGAGQISHRYSKEGFLNPTIYCREMFSLIRELRTLIFSKRAKELLRSPEANLQELISSFLSEHAIYLIREVIKNPLSQKMQDDFLIKETFPHFIDEMNYLIEDTVLLSGVELLSLFLNRKLRFLDQNVALGEEEIFLKLQRFYQSAYLMRFWQIQSLNNEKNIEAAKQFISYKNQLEEGFESISYELLSLAGKMLFRMLVDEFLPEKNKRARI